MSGGVVLPVSYAGTATGWELVDYLTLARESAVAAGGTCSIELPPLEDDARWLIDHVVTSCSSTTVTDLRWYDGSTTARNVIEQTDNGNLDVGDWSGLQRTPGSTLTFVWTGASAGARGTLNLQARVLRRRS